MAESLDDGEFWLPPQFLSDDDCFFDKKQTNRNTTPLKSCTKDVLAFGTETTQHVFPLDFPYGFDIYNGGISSDLSSPVDSLVASAEHSDEEDLITCKMARGDFKRNDLTFGTENTKGRAVSVSPQSTLCGVGSECSRCRKLSSHGSPNQGTGVSSPPATWDLLHAAAGEVARIKMDEEGCIMNSYNRGILGQPNKLSIVPVNLKNSNPCCGFFQQQSVAYPKLQAAQFHELRQQQIMKQQGTEARGVPTKCAAAVYSQQQQVQPIAQSRGRNIVGPVGLSPSVWPPIQVQHRQAGSGVRSAFLASRGAKRECTGTGVFLPRQIGTPVAIDSRKKTACTTVLLPEKVVQALNLDGGSQKPQLHRLSRTIHPGGGEIALRPRNCNGLKRNLRPQPEFNSTEARLPQEWTY